MIISPEDAREIENMTYHNPSGSPSPCPQDAGTAHGTAGNTDCGACARNGNWTQRSWSSGTAYGLAARPMES